MYSTVEPAAIESLLKMKKKLIFSRFFVSPFNSRNFLNFILAIYSMIFHFDFPSAFVFLFFVLFLLIFPFRFDDFINVLNIHPFAFVVRVLRVSFVVLFIVVVERHCCRRTINMPEEIAPKLENLLCFQYHESKCHKHFLAQFGLKAFISQKCCCRVNSKVDWKKTFFPAILSNSIFYTFFTTHSPFDDSRRPTESGLKVPHFFCSFSHNFPTRTRCCYLVWAAIFLPPNWEFSSAYSASRSEMTKKKNWNFSIVFFGIEFHIHSLKSQKFELLAVHTVRCPAFSVWEGSIVSIIHMRIFWYNLTSFTRKYIVQITFHFRCYK